MGIRSHSGANAEGRMQNAEQAARLWKGGSPMFRANPWHLCLEAAHPHAALRSMKPASTSRPVAALGSNRSGKIFPAGTLP